MLTNSRHGNSTFSKHDKNLFLKTKTQLFICFFFYLTLPRLLKWKLSFETMPSRRPVCKIIAEKCTNSRHNITNPWAMLGSYWKASTVLKNISEVLLKDHKPRKSTPFDDAPGYTTPNDCFVKTCLLTSVLEYCTRIVKTKLSCSFWRNVPFVWISRSFKNLLGILLKST